MFDSIVQAIADYPYLGVALFFLICGLGFPLPEELVLIAGGYICAKFPDKAQLGLMMLWCGGSILAFDLLPFVLGRIFGARIMRLRWLRITFTRKRLATFDRWFRRRGDLVIFLARFLAGIRVIAFFTAGTMKMRWRRFLLLDGLGILILVPLMVWLGYGGAGVIDDVIARVQAIEKGILWLMLAGLVLSGLWYGLWRRQQRRRTHRRPAETYIEPRLPVQDLEAIADGAGRAATAADNSTSDNTARPDEPASPPAGAGAAEAVEDGGKPNPPPAGAGAPEAVEDGGKPNPPPAGSEPDDDPQLDPGPTAPPQKRQAE